MKKISRKDLQGLRRQFPVLSKEDMRHYVGGYAGGGYFGGGTGYGWGDGYGDFGGGSGGYLGGSSDNYYDNAFNYWLTSGNYFYDENGNFFWSNGDYFTDAYGNPFMYGGSGNSEYGYGYNGEEYAEGYFKTDCVAYTVSLALGNISQNFDKVSIWIENNYGKKGVPGDKYYEVLNHFFEGSATPIPPSEYHRFGKNPGLTLLAAIKIPNSHDGHSVYVTDIEGTSVSYIDPQNNNAGACSTFDIVFLYRIDGRK